MNIYYANSSYRSFARTARAYRRLLSLDHSLVGEIQDADVVILHCEPHKYPMLYSKHPVLAKKYVIGYVAWEADQLPLEYISGIALVQELWTPSRFAREVFSQHHASVYRIPHHIDRDMSFSSDDLAYIDTLLAFNNDRRYMLTICRLTDRRKNIRTLLSAFATAFLDDPSYQLIVKADPCDVHPYAPSNNITFIREKLSEGKINALYSRMHSYASAHHGEAWGLTLSDALLFGIKPVATNWSGNIDFLNNSNSYLVPAPVRHISKEDCFGMFDEFMQWAYPDIGVLSNVLSRSLNLTPAYPSTTALDLSMQSRAEVVHLMKQRLR